MMMSMTSALCGVLLATAAHGLAPPPQPIRKVAIVGSGIAGLSLAQALENSPNLQGNGEPIEVTVYDSRPSLNYEAGAGVQLNGGLSVLNKLNPDVYRAVADAALPLKGIESRCMPWFGDKPFDTLLKLTVEEAIRIEGGQVEEELVLDGEVTVRTIMRGALQQALMDTLPPSTRKRVKFGKSLSRIEGNDGILVGFEDGSSEGPFDLVVGCDGVNSVVKEYINTGKIPESGRKGTQALYSGIRIRFAVQDEDVSVPDEGAHLRQYFGTDGAYALAGTYGNGKGRPPVKCAFTIHQDLDYFGPFRKKEARRSTGVDDENTDWSQDNRKGTAESMLEQIAECGVPDFEVGPIIDKSSRFFELGVYLHNPISLKGWSKEVEGSGGRFCTLDGDAAHAMPPFLGQGSNQAIQDSYCLAERLFQYNEAIAAGDVEQDVKSVLKGYERIRWKPTTSITVKAILLGYLEASTGPIAKFRDVFFRTMGALGVARKIYFGAALPVVNEQEK